MPTYTVRTANLPLADAQKERIAAAITAAHNAHTGAPAYFAQIIFDPLDAGSHFLGGKPNPSPHVFVRGLIRSGRADEVKAGIIRQIVEQVSAITGLDTEDVWVYLQDIAATQMVEFGRFLPQPGAEDEWRKGFSSQKLARLARAGITV